MRLHVEMRAKAYQDRGMAAADAKRQHEHRGYPEPWIAPKRAQGIAHVAPQRLD